tara:strand:+ start:36893 stop:37660 length:768 start_codon:yes stop_codon:yes gene_type:complete
MKNHPTPLTTRSALCLFSLAFGLLPACTAEISNGTAFDAGAGSDASAVVVDANANDLADGATFEADAMAVETATISHSMGALADDTNVNCRLNDPQETHLDTRHFRVFTAESAIGGSRIIEAILPIELAQAPEGMQPATIKFHKLTGSILSGSFVELSSTPFIVPNQVLGEVRVPLNFDVALGDAIVVEVSIPDGQEERSLRMGYNLQPQTGPSYIASNGCGQAQPVDVASLDDPNNPGQTLSANSWLISLVVER